MRANVLPKRDMSLSCGRKALSAACCHTGRAVAATASNSSSMMRLVPGPFQKWRWAEAVRHGSSMQAVGATGSVAAASTTMDSSGRPRVCILGGGFGGLYTAIKLELLMWPKGKKPQITLIDQGERFIFKPLLYELLNGTAQSWEVAPTFAQLLAPYTIQFVQDKVADVQPDLTLNDGGSASGGVVQLASGTTLPYDWLVVALGASADSRGVPGIKENARPFNTLSDAEFIAGRLAAFEARAALNQQQQQQQATIMIVGAGYAGCELAAVVGERMKGKASVVVVTPGPSILESAPAGQRQAAEEALRSLGVTIMTNTTVTGVQRAGTEASASSSSATAAAETAMSAAATAAAASTSAGAAAADLPPRPQSPEAAAVEPLAVLAAAAAAASPTTPGSSSGSTTAATGTSSSNGNGIHNSSPAASSNQGASGSYGSAGEDATYVVQLEPVWGSVGGEASSSMPADLVLWTAGAKPASTPLEPFPLDSRGQLETDATLRVLKHSRVFALGDVAKGKPGNDGSSSSSSGGFYPATAQVAFQQADYAAWNIWSAINGRALLPFRYQHLGDMMSLGASNAAVAFPIQLPSELTSSINGTPLGDALSLAGIKLTPGSEGLVLEGPLAQLLRRAAYLYRQPTNEQRLNVAASWIEQAVTTAARLAAELSATSSSRDGAGTRY